MTALIYATIGTDSYWGPPKLARFDIDNDLTITNSDPLEWRIEGKGHVTRAAIYVNGGWHAVGFVEPKRVRKHDTFTIPAGDLVIRAHLEHNVDAAPALPTAGLLPRGEDVVALGPGDASS